MSKLVVEVAVAEMGEVAVVSKTVPHQTQERVKLMVASQGVHLEVRLQELVRQEHGLFANP